jgi:hypothetical protein
MLEAPLIERMVTWATRTVVALDVYQAVQGCDCVVLNLDGRVPDEGSLVEASLAWYAGRPVVPFKTTPITELGINNNPMVDVITRWAPPVDNPALLPAAVARALQKRPSIDLALVPPEVGRLCELGKMIWAIRRQRLLTPAAAARTVGELQALPPSLRSLIEPVSLLQSRAFSVVVGVIELSKLRINDPKRKVLVKKLVKETKAWSQTPGVQAAVRKNAETA